MTGNFSTIADQVSVTLDRNISNTNFGDEVSSWSFLILIIGFLLFFSILTGMLKYYMNKDDISSMEGGESYSHDGYTQRISYESAWKDRELLNLQRGRI
uniref:Uncharacterized protein n=1 Tax=Lepeophtheirus salmonis TaxID=72036 RepID=A0A0K2VG37_LEPSM